ncbi:MAG: hypothetical protein AAF318_14175 [Pseudomonadota bacterium]
MASDRKTGMGDPAAVTALLALVTGTAPRPATAEASAPRFAALDFEFLLRAGAIELPRAPRLVVATVNRRR